MNVDELIEAGLYHEFHVSERREFKKCRWAWDWKFRERWYPNVTAMPLEFGTAFHNALEALYKHVEIDLDIAKSMAYIKFKATIDEQRVNALTHLKNFPDLTVEKLNDEYQERLVLGMGMLKHYNETFLQSFIDRFEVVAIEQKFAVPIPGIWCSCDDCKLKWRTYLSTFEEPVVDLHGSEFIGLPVALAGKIDLMVRERSTQRIWAIDWKTTTRIAHNHEFLELDEQVSNYLWALNQIGLNPAGFIYHEQLKAWPEEPEELNRSYKGRKFSTNKNQPTSYELFLSTVKERDPLAYGSGLYDEYLLFLQNEGMVYYQATEIRKSKEELALVGDNLITEASERFNPHLKMYPTPTKYGCLYCEFRQPCIERMRAGDYATTLRSTFSIKPHYYEDKESTTED